MRLQNTTEDLQSELAAVQDQRKPSRMLTTCTGKL